MNVQFKKGVLDLVILHVVGEASVSAYDIIVRLRDALDINENTVYPLLRRLENDKYLQHQKIQGEMGAPRKVFLLSEAGKAQLALLNQEWQSFYMQVNRLLGGKTHE